MTTHAELQGQLEDLLRMTGWGWLHVRKSIGRRGGARGWQTTTNISGWPDVAPVWSPRQPGRFLAIEVKIPPDIVRDDQAEVLSALAAAGMEVFVLWPGTGKAPVLTGGVSAGKVAEVVTIEELAKRLRRV